MLNLRKKEKKVAALVGDYLDSACECLDTARGALHAYVDGNTDLIEEQFLEVAALESKADDLRRQIRDQLFEGAFMPSVREDVYRMVSVLDDVPNCAEGCCRFFHLQRPDVPAEMREDFNRLIDISYGSFAPACKAVALYFKKKAKLSDVRELCEACEEAETAVDSLELALTERIFQATDADLSRRRQMRIAVKRIADISDLSEDAADAIILAALKAVV
jgi:predicted phosphate transport protein (TIGR00153 family)